MTGGRQSRPPSPRRAGAPGAAVTLVRGGPGLSASLGLPLRGTREARGTGFHRHPPSSRVPAPLRLRGLAAPDAREALSGRGAPAAGDGESRSRLAAPGSRVGSEPAKAENVLGRDRAQTHSSLSTEPPTYFNPPPSLLLPPSSRPRDSTPPSPAPQPCPAPAH